LAVDAPLEGYGRIGGEHGRRRQVPLQHAPPAGLGLGARQALDVSVRRLGGERRFVDVGRLAGAAAEKEQVEAHADLRQELAPAWAARGEIDAAFYRTGHGAILCAMVGVPGEQGRSAVKLLEEDELRQRVR